MIALVLLLGTLRCSSQDPVPSSAPPSASPLPSSLTQDQQHWASWRGEVLELLGRLTQDQQHWASWRGEVLELLGRLIQGQQEQAGRGEEVSRLLAGVEEGMTQLQAAHQNHARHQSQVLENHQALLLQVTRTAAQLQDLAQRTRPAEPAADQ